MSRNIGHIVFEKDGGINYIIFNGTVEQCYPELYDSYDSARAAFEGRTFGIDRPYCTCGSREPVIIVPYDSAPVPVSSTIHWRGTACRNCRCIDSGLIRILPK